MKAGDPAIWTRGRYGIYRRYESVPVTIVGFRAHRVKVMIIQDGHFTYVSPDNLLEEENEEDENAD